MYLIRMSEEKIRQYYPEDEMKTPAHLCLGEEAIVVGVCQALAKEDKIFGFYRGHGIYLARTGDTDKFFAEIYGKKTGEAKGKAGSMHIFAPKHGFLGASAIVASTIPVAVGCAFSMKYQKKDSRVAVFFGDGAVDEGVFWESINFASLKKLPIIFICEDNDLAIHAKVSHRHGFSSITNIAKQFNLNVFESKSTDAEVIFKLTKKAINLCRKTGKPSLLHLKYYRYLEHVGINYDFHFGYRKESEFKKWFKVDPLNLQRNKLLKMKVKEEDLQKLEKKIIRKIEKSISRAKKAPFPEEEELYRDVYSD